MSRVLNTVLLGMGLVLFGGTTFAAPFDIDNTGGPQDFFINVDGNSPNITMNTFGQTSTGSTSVTLSFDFTGVTDPIADAFLTLSFSDLDEFGQFIDPAFFLMETVMSVSIGATTVWTPSDGSIHNPIDLTSLLVGQTLTTLDVDVLFQGDLSYWGQGEASFTNTMESASGNISGNSNEVPEPTTMALLGAGGLALLRKRRRTA